MAEAKSPSSYLPLELRLRVLSLLTPNDLALGGRLSCKDAAQRFNEPRHRTARLSEPLPDHVVAAAGERVGEVETEGAERGGGAHVEHAARAATQLDFRQKLLLLSTAAASGYEANVEFALQLLQPHVFLELLQTDYYLAFWQRSLHRQVLDAGSVAMASGLAHLLPSLVRRCPGLLDPGRILVAAARHCDLAGLQLAWEAVGQLLLSRLDRLPPLQLDERLMRSGGEPERMFKVQGGNKAWLVWWRMMDAAACSSTPDATAKMAWVLDKARAHSQVGVEHGEVWGAAAASGDPARLRWLQERGFRWGGAEALAPFLRHADLGFIVRMEPEGGWLPPPGTRLHRLRSGGLAPAAAASSRDSAAKLSWLAGRGIQVGTVETMEAAAEHGNLAALQLAVQHWRQQQQGEASSAAPPHSAMYRAVWYGHVPTAAWLHQAGCKLPRGMPGTIHLPMLRWLLEAGCPTEGITLAALAERWPSCTPADSERLVEALQLLVAAGVPARRREGWHPLLAAAYSRHPWPVWHFLQQQASADTVPGNQRGQLATFAVAAGNEVIIGAVSELGWLPGVNSADAISCYALAAAYGDLGTLACLHRLEVPMGEGELAAAIKRGAPLPALRWLVGHGASTQSALAPFGIFSSLGSYYTRDQERQEVQAWLLERPQRGGREAAERLQ